MANVKQKSVSRAPAEKAGTKAGKKTQMKQPQSSNPSAADMIAEAAYYRAEKRGFEPGYDMQDWLEAEDEVNAGLLR